MQNNRSQIEELFNLAKDIYLLSTDMPAMIDLPTHYNTIIYTDFSSKSINNIINQDNIPIFTDLLLNDIKNGLPYAIYVYSVYHEYLSQKRMIY